MWKRGRATRRLEPRSLQQCGQAIPEVLEKIHVRATYGLGLPHSLHRCSYRLILSAGNTRRFREQALLVSWGITLAILIPAAIVQSQSTKFFPPVEDQFYYFLHSGLSDLTSFTRTGATLEKENALEALAKAASALDSWTWGNLKFLKEGAGKAILAFRDNFKGRLLPAIRNSDKSSAQGFLMPLTGMMNILDLNQLDEAHIESWNNWLTRKNSVTSKDDYPYQLPTPKHTFRVSMLYKTTFARIVTIATACLIAGVGMYLLALSIGLSVAEAFAGSAVIFSGLFVGLATLLRSTSKSGQSDNPFEE